MSIGQKHLHWTLTILIFSREPIYQCSNWYGDHDDQNDEQEGINEKMEPRPPYRWREDRDAPAKDCEKNSAHECITALRIIDVRQLKKSEDNPDNRAGNKSPQIIHRELNGCRKNIEGERLLIDGLCGLHDQSLFSAIQLTSWLGWAQFEIVNFDQKLGRAVEAAEPEGRRVSLI